MLEDGVVIDDAGEGGKSKSVKNAKRRERQKRTKRAQQVDGQDTETFPVCEGSRQLLGVDALSAAADAVEDDAAAPDTVFGKTATAFSPEIVRFHLTPFKGWDRFIRGMRCSARNVLKWKGVSPIPAAPEQDAPCWLLATSDETSVCIARLQSELRAAGWKILTSAPHVVERLGNKALLRDWAHEIGLIDHLPTPYATAEEACYPCILKSATGEFGKDCFIVGSSDEVAKIAPTGLQPKWVLQELTYGRLEYSASLLVDRGCILESLGTKYEYGSEAYVYPNVQKVGKEPYDVSAEHLSLMTAFLRDYSGICNFNYKIKDSGALSIFEVNTRVGGDLAVDIPRARARSLFERLDTLSGDGSSSTLVQNIS